MKSYFVQGVTVCLVHLLLLANAAPVPSDDLYGDNGDPFSFWTLYYGQDIDVPNPTIPTSSLIPNVPTSTICDRQEYTGPNIDDEEELNDLHIAPSAHGKRPYAYRVTEQDISTPKAQTRLVQSMLRDRVTTSSGPWHIEGEWSTPVLRIMIQNLRNRRLRHITPEPHVHPGSMVWEDDNPIKVAQMERTELVCVMDSLWTWARQTLMRLYKNRAVERSQATIHDIEIGKLKVEVIEVKKLIQAILGSVPEYDDFDPSKLPWHNGDNDVFRWKQAFRIVFVKKVLPYMWLKMKNDRTTLTGEHPVSEEQQKILDGDPEELFNAMDKAWEKWLARRQRRLGSNNRYRAKQRRKRVATDLPKIQ